MSGRIAEYFPPIAVASNDRTVLVEQDSTDGHIGVLHRTASLFKRDRHGFSVVRYWVAPFYSSSIRRGRIVWPSAHAWKACMRKRIEGSNPSPSAIARLP